MCKSNRPEAAARDHTTNKTSKKPLPASPPKEGTAKKVKTTTTTEFRFVNQLGTKDQDEDAKSEVKSHVMRRVWKKHKDTQAKWIKRVPAPLRIKEVSTPGSDISSSASSFHSPDPQSRCCTTSSRDRSSRRSQSIAAATPGVTRDTGVGTDCADIPIPSGYCHISPRGAAYIFGSDSDPFGTLPIPLTPRLHQLIHHGARDPTSTPLNEDSHDSIAICTVTNAALLYITLSWLAAKIGDSDGPENFESSFYLQSSLSAVNKDLESSPDHGLSEGTIAAVACMTNMENLSGERNRAVIHMNGLEQMVKIRGGLGSLSGVLRRLLLWTDLLYATSWQLEPRFPFQDFSHLPPLSSYLPYHTTSPILTLSDALFQQVIDTSNCTLLPTLQDAHQLAHLLDIVPSSDVDYLNEASYPDRVYTVEHHILTLLATNDEVMDETPARIITPLLHSLLLYVYTNLRLTPVGGQIRRTLVDRLRIQLQNVDVALLNCTLPAEIMWMLFLGGTAAAHGGADRKWFREKLWWTLKTSCAMEWGWDRTGRLLKDVLWLEREFFDDCRMFWIEALELEWVEGF